MKTRLKMVGLGVVCASAILAQLGSAATYNPDTLLGSGALGNSGDPFVNSWASGLIGASVTLTDITFSPFQDDASNWVIDVDPDMPGYFLLKFGDGGTDTSIDHYLFDNVFELTKLVWTNEQVNYLTGGDCGASSLDACNIGRLSHVRVSEIPVPATLGLLGLGLTGLGLFRRKKA